jgi:hypothetical protein
MKGVDESIVRWGCPTFCPTAADPLVRRWLTHPHEIFRETSLESLSGIGRV